MPVGAAAADTSAVELRQCGRSDLPATTSQRQKSRASIRVARFHSTPHAHKNLNQRNRSSP